MWRPLRSPNRGWRLLGVGRNGKINTSLGLSLPPTSGHCSPCPLLPNWTRAPISAGHSPASKSKSSCEVGQLQRSTRTHSMAGQRAGPVAGNFFFFWLCWVFVAAHRLSVVVASVGSSPVAVCRLLIVVASRCRAQVLGCVSSVSCSMRALERRLSGWGAGAQLPCGMWDLPRQGNKPASPALAGGFFTTGP